MAKVIANGKKLMVHDQFVNNFCATIKEAQSRMKRLYVLHHKDCEFKGDWICLTLRPYRQVLI